MMNRDRRDVNHPKEFCRTHCCDVGTQRVFRCNTLQISSICLHCWIPQFEPIDEHHESELNFNVIFKEQKWPFDIKMKR